jgi:hypothetical protein
MGHIGNWECENPSWMSAQILSHSRRQEGGPFGCGESTHAMVRFDTRDSEHGHPPEPFARFAELARGCELG